MNTLDQFAMAALTGIMASKQSREPHHHAQDVNDAFDIAEKMIEERAKRYSLGNRSVRRRAESLKSDALGDTNQTTTQRTVTRRRKPVEMGSQEEVVGPEGLEPSTK